MLLLVSVRSSLETILQTIIKHICWMSMVQLTLHNGIGKAWSVVLLKHCVSSLHFPAECVEALLSSIMPSSHHSSFCMCSNTRLFQWKSSVPMPSELISLHLSRARSFNKAFSSNLIFQISLSTGLTLHCGPAARCKHIYILIQNTG